jgi:hypothetical protein
VKWPVTLPPLTLQVGESTSSGSLDVSWQLVSILLNPVPVTDTEVPVGPSDGLRIIVATNGLVTVNTACALSPPLLAESLIVYEPGATFAIVNEPAGAPLPITTLQAAF